MPDGHPRRSALETVLVPLMLLACAACGGAASSSGTTCAPIDTVQCTAPDCYPTWAAVQASSPHCFDVSGWKETRGSCDGDFLRFVSGVDFRSVYYYDKASGALVAVASSINARGCAAGAEGVPSEASCPTDGATVDPCTADAGAGN